MSREHLIRLQHENKMLKLAQEGSDNEKIALLQSLLEDANRRKSELETENRSATTLHRGSDGSSPRLLTALWFSVQADQPTSDGGAESGGGAAEVAAGARIQS